LIQDSIPVAGSKSPEPLQENGPTKDISSRPMLALVHLMLLEEKLLKDKKYYNTISTETKIKFG
jgi:hypothetical protein